MVSAPASRACAAALRNISPRRHGLEHEAEGLGAPMQIVDDPRAVADLVAVLAERALGRSDAPAVRFL